jgi:hypothetical protein
LAEGLKIRVLIQFGGEPFILFFITHQKSICRSDTAIETPSVKGGIAAHGEHLLFEEVGGSRIDAFDLEVEVEGLPFHQLEASSIHSHLAQFIDGLSGIGDVKASYQIHPVMEFED